MPNEEIEFHSEAAEEVVATIKWYQARSPAVAEAFARELERAIQKILDAPERWPRDSTGLRRLLLHRFPFSVVYRVEVQCVKVIAVAHAHRRPRYWLSRT